MQGETGFIKFERKFCPTCRGTFERVDRCPDDGSELRGPENDPLVGTPFADRYLIEALLGFGGMSVVYKAKHLLMNRAVAIKMLHADIKSDHLSLERFRLEAQAASSLSHHNIISVYDFGLAPTGEAFFVMDFLEGESLAEMLVRKGRLPWERAISIFKQICDGLSAAHRKSIIHRDLKPANVIIIKDAGVEIVKLVDFGIAKMLPASGKQQQQLTKTGEVFGSPIYMSPEQCMGKELDTRSDIYSLGCLMYEALAGEPPLLGETFLATLNKHVGEIPRPIAETAPDAKVPVEFEQIILKCMAKDPDNRFQTAEEISDELAVLSLSMTNTGAGRAAVSGAMGTIAPTRSLTGPRKPAASPGSMVWKIVAAVCLVTSLVVLGVATLWTGPIEDRGSPMNKLIWQFSLSNGQSATQRNSFESAEHSLAKAESMARTFGDRNTRLEATLRAKAELYSQWEGHAQALEKTNIELANLMKERLTQEMKMQYDALSRLGATATDSPVAESNAKLRAEAQVPSILAMSGRLHGQRRFVEQSQFLEKAISVEKKFLDNDSSSIATLEAALADAY
ncbi:MAG TPA: protein kinase, partial [Chroococcales cyanobacterium]